MPVEHSPADRPQDGKITLPKCNNEEKKWASQVTQRTQILQMQVQGILGNNEATATDYSHLEKEIRKARREFSSEWEVFKSDCETRGRNEALSQLGRRWQAEEQKLADAVLATNQARHAKFPRDKSGGNTDQTDVLGQDDQTSSTEALSADQASDDGAQGAVPKEARRETSGKTQTREPEVADTLGQFADMMAELRTMKEQMRQSKNEVQDVNHAWQARMNEALQKQREEFRKIILDERSRHEQARQNWEKRTEQRQKAQHDYHHEQIGGSRGGRSSTPDRARGRFRRQSHAGPRARLYSDGDVRQSFCEHPGSYHPGEGGNRHPGEQWQEQQELHVVDPSLFQRPPPCWPPRTTGATNAQQRQPQQSHLFENAVIQKYASNIPRYGEQGQRLTAAQAAGDEGDDFYRANFPYPFNEPPPPDAKVISEYRKLEGMTPKFSGREQDYPTWAALFLEVVHKVKCPLGWKAMILASCLDTTHSRLREIHAGTGATRQDYVRTITRLVRAYGHPQGEVAARREDLDEITAVRHGDFSGLEIWHMRLENFADAAKKLGKESELTDYRLYEENVSRMDYTLAQEYYTWCRSRHMHNDTITLLAWLGEAVDTARNIQRTSRRRKEMHQVHAAVAVPGRSRAGSDAGRPTQRRRPCPLDGEDHGLALCDKFKKMDPFERREKLKEWKRCYACLHPGHNIKECGKGVICQLCKHKHHTLLHGTSRSQVRAIRDVRAHVADAEGDDWSEDSAPDSEDEGEQQVALKANGTRNKVALQTVPIVVHNGRRKIRTNLLMDQGATGAFISKKLADRLGLVGHVVDTTVTGFDGVKITGPAVMAHIQVSATGEKKRHWVQVQVSKDPAGSYQPYDWSKEAASFPHLKNIPVAAPVPDVPVEIMIGMDSPHLVASLVPDVGAERAEQPVARKTRLGWVVAGPTTEKGSKEQRSAIAFFAKTAWIPTEHNQWGTHQFGMMAEKQENTHAPPQGSRSRDEELRQLVGRMWEIDAAYVKAASTPEEEKIFQHLREQLVMKDNKYELPTLWKPGEPDIQNNYGYAVGRLKSLLKSAAYNTPEVQTQYQEQIREWIQEGYVEEVNTESPATDKATYLPHFPVVRMDKLTTQVRIVMDAAAKTTKGKSLNDCLNKGPKLVNELITVLMRFRMKRITLAADIKKMFYQIVLREEDRDYHRFLWQDQQGHIKVFRWKVHPFGSAASPCIAIFTIKEHARKWKHLFPEAANTVIHSTLVDDNLDSVNTEQEAIELGRQLVELFKRASMRLSKIASNSAEVVAAFPPEMVAKSLEVADFCTKGAALPLVKALGIIYLCETDEFSFKMEPTDKAKKWTKREVLRYEAKLYDPHGLIAPHTARARIILQKLWRHKVEWDEQLPEEILKEWETWLQDTQELPQLRIPRGLNPNTEKDFHIHIFADASSDAYAAAAYLVTKSSCLLMLSKVRVAPLHMTSIPRLELMAAVLALEMGETIQASLERKQDKLWYWTDSRNVLAWIATDSRSLHTFVGTRVAKIQQQAGGGEWRWVDSPNNPANMPSRGTRLRTPEQKQLWFTGPAFLREKGTPWPSQPDDERAPQDALKEIKKGASFAFNLQTHTGERDAYSPETDHFPVGEKTTASWEKVLRVVARCRRMRPGGRAGKQVTAQELKEAEICVIKSIQKTSFARTLKEMATPPGTLTQGSAVKHLLPILDKDGLIRRTSRLTQMSHVPYDVKYQIILPKDHPLVPMLIDYVHRKLLHAGPQHTMAYLAKMVWILKGSALTRRVISRCITCRKKRAAPTNPVMGPLPECRLPPVRVDPFAFTAIDAAGPFFLQEERKDPQKKVYFLLLTCLVYRAIHLEPLQNMTTNAFLNALQRFTARRGVPEKIISDNGSNFVAGHSELKELWSAEAKAEYREKMPQIEWEFIPPYSPHFGGVYERLVQATKNALYHTFKPQHTVARDQFHTALAVVEGILNSRPLTYYAAGEDSLHPLTPADFMNTAPFRELAVPPGTDVALHTKWRKLQDRLNYFWKRFQEEIIPYLQKTTKWKKKGRNIEVGDVVVHLDGSRRGAWPLARVLQTEEGKDGVVRRITILSKGTAYKRAANKVMVLLPKEQEDMLNKGYDGTEKADRQNVEESTNQIKGDGE